MRRHRNRRRPDAPASGDDPRFEVPVALVAQEGPRAAIESAVARPAGIEQQRASGAPIVELFGWRSSGQWPVPAMSVPGPAGIALAASHHRPDAERTAAASSGARAERPYKTIRW